MAHRIEVLSVPVDVLTFGEALEAVATAVGRRAGVLKVLAINPEKIFAVRQSDKLRKNVETAGLLLPDGIGVVLAARLNGHKVERLAGSDFMHGVCSLAAQKNLKVFLFGSRIDVVDKTVSKLSQMYPGIDIVGSSHGYVSTAESEALLTQIDTSEAQILFVGLGSPRQEEWIANFGDRLKFVRVIQGVGGTFDTIGGTVARAPSYMIKLNLEWLHRLLLQPSRIGRQLKLARFAFEVLSQSLFHPDRQVSRDRAVR